VIALNDNSEMSADQNENSLIEHKEPSSETKQVDYNEFIHFIFLGNTEAKRIFMTFEENKIGSVKDLFKCCLDIFCKGLVKVYGGTDQVVELNSLSMDQIQCIIDKLFCTGIVTMIRILSNEGNINEGGRLLQKTLNDLENMEENLELHEYFVIIQLHQFMIEIRFNIIL
jgi:hypothetical protein